MFKLIKQVLNLFSDTKDEANTKMEPTTTEFFQSKEEYLKFRDKFSELATDKSLNSAHYYLLRNVLLHKPLENGFTPIQSQIKIENGQRAYGSLIQAHTVLVKLLEKEKGYFGLPDHTIQAAMAELTSKETTEFMKELWYADYQL